MLNTHEPQLVDVALHVGDHATHDRANRGKISIENVSFWYGTKQALHSVSLNVFDREVTAFIGPSGCGKTTLLKCLNRTAELTPDTRIEGRIQVDAVDIAGVDEIERFRSRFGWVAQRPNPFFKSIYDNVAYGARIHGLVRNREESDELVRRKLELAGLWDEVKDRLDEPAPSLSGGQQQRLCVARALSTEPEVLLMDEPASALDPSATAHLEELIDELRRDYCIVLVTHNLQQAARVAQRTAYFHMGRLVEAGDTAEIFLRPKTDLCARFVTGKFG